MRPLSLPVPRGIDPAAAQKKIKPGTFTRALHYAKPHVGLLLLFLLIVSANAGIGIANPLIYREIINVGILTSNTPLIIKLALAVAGLGILDAALGLLQTYLATRI